MIQDSEVLQLIRKEELRQNQNIELIASENYPSRAVREACASIFTAKYAEGYPGKRYYGGCENVDEVERLCIERCKALFHVGFANVQPHSGSQANFAAYHAILNPGDKVLSLTLNDGGHLTHGSPVSFSKHLYQFVHYPLGPDGKLDYGIIADCLEKEMPDCLLAGYSAYPYAIDFKKMRELVDTHNQKHGRHCYFIVDMAHIAGIVAAGLCQNPCDYADIVTSTTHKTLRGPRGGIILTNDAALAKRIDSAVFPYAQGGPLEHIIAAKAIAFREAEDSSFKAYIQQVLENTRACAEELCRLGAVTSGTENHLFLLDVLQSFGCNGKEAQAKLELNGITTNKNMIHGDTLSPGLCSGIRIGFAAVTSRGCTKQDAIEIARIIYDVLSGNEKPEKPIKTRVNEIVNHWKNVLELYY